jgi:transposase
LPYQVSDSGDWLKHGRVEIDINAMENAISPTAIGKKNWLPASRRSCRYHLLDPTDYLRDVLSQNLKNLGKEEPR